MIAKPSCSKGEVLRRGIEAYARFENLSGRQLAWEFLRRCDDYRADYSAYQAQRAAAESHGTNAPQFWHAVQDERDRLCRKWGFHPNLGLTSPETDEPPPLQFFPTQWSPLVVGHCLDGKKVDYSNELSTAFPTVSFAIHLGRDLKYQFEFIRRMIHAYEQQGGISSPPRPKARNRTDRYPDLLRILDALLVGAEPSEIATAFYGKGKRATDRAAYAIERATYLARTGYADLYTLNEPRPSKERN